MGFLESMAAATPVTSIEGVKRVYVRLCRTNSRKRKSRNSMYSRGHAMLVPSFVELALTFALLALTISAPGAQTSTQLPKLLEGTHAGSQCSQLIQRASFFVVAPTAMADVADAGE